MTGMTPSYPKRGKHFLHRLLRKLHTVAEGSDKAPAAVLGTNVTALLVLVADWEDRVRYKRPPTFYLEQLQAVLGFAKRDRAIKVRQQAIAAGWLAYVAAPLGSRRPGSYWVVCPELDGPDAPPESGCDDAADAPPNTGHEENDAPPKQGHLRAPKKGTLLNLEVPEPRKPEPRERVPACAGDTSSAESLSWFVEQWNCIEGVVHVSTLTSGRKAAWAKHCCSSDWRDHAERVLAQVRASDFLRGVSDRGWRPTFDWLLKPANWTKVEEGAYADSGKRPQKGGFVIGPGQRYDPDAAKKYPDYGKW